MLPGLFSCIVSAFIVFPSHLKVYFGDSQWPFHSAKSSVPANGDFCYDYVEVN